MMILLYDVLGYDVQVYDVLIYNALITFPGASHDEIRPKQSQGEKEADKALHSLINLKLQIIKLEIFFF